MRLAKTLIDRNWTDPLPIFAWPIEHPEGLIVVDTGETAVARNVPFARMGVTREQELPTARPRRAWRSTTFRR